jgi:hypothetical protein
MKEKIILTLIRLLALVFGAGFVYVVSLFNALSLLSGLLIFAGFVGILGLIFWVPSMERVQRRSKNI